MLLGELMPVYDVAERHHIAVSAAPEVVYAAIRSSDLSGGLITRTLLAARATPAWIVAFARSPLAALTDLRAHRHRRQKGLRLAEFERAGFKVVRERPPQELVIGLLGQFWTASGGLCADVSAAHFAAGPPRGHALAGWTFTVEPQADGTTNLRTETRVLCADDARAKFRAYWLVVRPWSGLIRRSMLHAIRREAERLASPARVR